MNVTIETRSGLPGRVPAALIVTPRGGTTQPPIVIVHGILRDAEAVADRLAPRAAHAGRVLMLPVLAKSS